MHIPCQNLESWYDQDVDGRAIRWVYLIVEDEQSACGLFLRPIVALHENQRAKIGGGVVDKSFRF